MKWPDMKYEHSGELIAVGDPVRVPELNRSGVVEHIFNSSDCVPSVSILSGGKLYPCYAHELRLMEERKSYVSND